jgi:hypothetical protein
MSLIEKLEKRAKELSPWVLYKGRKRVCYELEVADDRELLEQAAKELRRCTSA